MKRSAHALLATATALSIILSGLGAMAAPPPSPLAQWSQLSGGRLVAKVQAGERPAFYAGTLSQKLPGTATERAQAFLAQNKTLFGNGEFAVASVQSDALGYEHVRLNQTFQGLPIFHAQVVTHFRAGVATAVHGTTVSTAELAWAPGKARISAEQAIALAKAAVGYHGGSEGEGVTAGLNYYGGNGKPVALAYNVHLTSFDENDTVQIDAASGAVLYQLANIETDGPATGSGVGVLGDTKRINTWQAPTTYYLRDTTKAMYTDGRGEIRTYTTSSHTALPGSLMRDANNVWNAKSQQAGVDAHFYAGKVYDFYASLLGRNSLDDAGMTIRSTVHYGSKYNNAFWNGSQMVYGDGDGSLFTALPGDPDVVGHEMSHAVTQYTSDLAYENESGALNEHFSDAMGVAFEAWLNGGTTNWLIGDEVYTPKLSGDALRDMACPTRYHQPQDMSHYVHTRSDGGGVHTNSGIPNKAFYLFASGGDGTTCSGRTSSTGHAGVGLEAARTIWYRANTFYATSTTDFSGFRAATLQAATDLGYDSNSATYRALQAAWDWVQVH